MKTTKLLTVVVGAIAFAAMAMIFPAMSLAHCDTLDGPVVATARVALEKGNITPILKWVSADKEDEIKTAFQKTLNVRTQGTEAKDLADMYFFETLVRIHREGEGAPYTGLKPGEAIDPAVALADKSLESANVDKLVNVLSGAMANGIRDRFYTAFAKQKTADDSIVAGREFVESYVIFTHYVEGLHGLIKGGATHHGESGENH